MDLTGQQWTIVLGQESFNIRYSGQARSPQPDPKRPPGPSSLRAMTAFQWRRTNGLQRL
jgi:hypothetical protein